ncbi:MAG: hypothetical protein ACRDL6_02520 [Solirubrobacterales bacterium]
MSARGKAAIALSVTALALGASGCIGEDDEEAATQPSIPVPETTAPPAPAETTPAPVTPTTTAPSGKQGGRKPDSPANDVPPASGSPEEQFERFCEQNPAACG